MKPVDDSCLMEDTRQAPDQTIKKNVTRRFISARLLLGSQLACLTSISQFYSFIYVLCDNVFIFAEYES